ncbi:MAG: TrkH family potassium uptake protein [Erysipelotrichaceae bacterium]|nr:TrkH family potassium uptake protein [Erysipelotrichaceae bacterium]
MTDKFKGLKIVLYYTGYIILGFSFLNLLPVAVALLYKDFNSALDFTLNFSISAIIAIGMMTYGAETKKIKNSINLRYGLTVASLTWIILTMLAAIPYMLSGHMLSYLDACFDVMSGFTTTGVFLLQDLDHISQALNFWRHLLTFVGGQGMVVLALSFFVKEMGSAYKFYVGEGKDIALMPNVKGTSQWIWKISMVYLAIGTLVLWISAMGLGLQPLSAFFHALYIFEAAWSTGGFAPNLQNVMYYHDFGFELIGMVFFIIGSFNFGLHFALIQGKRKEFFKNIEVISFTITSLLGTALAVFALKNAGVYSDGIALFRRVVYNVLSAHTTTGFGSIYARQFALEWGGLGITVMVIAMLIGGSACSTAGGIKGLRVGIIFKGIVSDIKKLVSGENSVKVVKYHHIKDLILDDAVFRSSAAVAILYLVMFAGGVIITTAYGYPLAESAFEVASVSGNVGLSIGIISAQMPTLMKWYYMMAMYLGRLEFISVLALIGLMFKGAKQWLRRY